MSCAAGELVRIALKVGTPVGSMLTASGPRAYVWQALASSQRASTAERALAIDPLRGNPVPHRDSASPCLPTLGFLTVLEHEQHGLTGGYLVLTTNGRPLEFHCTAPVKPSRAQQILFGPALAPYLYGEHIGQTLVQKGSATPLILFTDVAAALAVGQFVEARVALVLNGMQDNKAGGLAGLQRLSVGRNQLAIPASANPQDIAVQLQQFAEFDCSEPFGRIREAIQEAQRGAGAKAA